MLKNIIIFISFLCYSLCVHAQSIDTSHIAADIGAAVMSAGPNKYFYLRYFKSPYLLSEPPMNNTAIALASQSFDRDLMVRKIADGVVSLADVKTHVSPSHLGHPGYENAAFVYDKAVDALVLKAAGKDKEARAVLDYFAARLRIPLKEIKHRADANGVYGMLKLFPSLDAPKGVGLVNAVDCRSTLREGLGQLEFFTTPGPMAFMVLAFLSVDKKEYLSEAIKLGDVLLSMQNAEGGVIDGDRDAANIHTEPHMDCYSAFLMLYDVTGDEKWRIAAERAWEWFNAYVFKSREGVIYQGIRPYGPSEVFATDAYSWTMAGRAGERLPLKSLEDLTDRMLRRSLSQVTLELPDGKTKTVTLVDFADVGDVRISADRGGYHPMGSVEWVGGVILALQKVAVRFYEANDALKARFYKTLAEYFTRQAMDSFYEVDGVGGILSFYATGQWMQTGHGWRTPYFYVKDPAGNVVIKGGSTISAWPLLPLVHFNPFKLDDHYGRMYEAITLDEASLKDVTDYVAKLAASRAFSESVPTEMATDVGDIPEMWRYNVRMFKAFDAGDYYAAILWAQKIVSNETWVKLAKDQQARKAREVGGLVDYPWGTDTALAKEQLRVIQHYPLLNEMGTAMWAMAVANFKLGNRDNAKAWVKTLMETVPLHQIFAPAGPGYWNAIVSWDSNPGGTVLDAEMGLIYREILAEKGLLTAVPKTVVIK